jgi:ABC-type transport system involved in Fe-S cluster assembly fused permease/ATPase subunit
VNILQYFTAYVNSWYQTQLIHSVGYWAVRFFLTVDPITHSTRSSGKIIAKVNRGSESYETFLDIFSFDVWQTMVGMITAVVVIGRYNLMLGVIAFVSLFTVALLSIVIKTSMINITAPRWIKVEDTLKASNVETLQEVFHIRSSFASEEQDQKNYTNHTNLAVTIATSWYSGISTDILIKIVYVFSTLFLTYKIFGLIETGVLKEAIGISLIVTYLSGSSDVLRIGKRIERALDRYTRIQDLFEFIRTFGKQSYPVLKGDILSRKGEF